MTICSGAGRALLLVGCLSVGSTVTAATVIRGAARNQTTDKPAAGDEVVLLRLAEGMQDEARTTTDARGEFSLIPESPFASYVVRVLHQGVNYDQTVTSADPLQIAVFDAVPKVRGIKGSLGIARIESDGTTVKVTEMYNITNTSAPPLTQSGAHNFVMALPDRATFELVEVRGGGARGLWVKVAPVPVKGQKGGHYAVDFPLRPGDTFFKFAYHLPYQGPTSFHLELAYPIARFAVLVPPSMSFQASRSGSFRASGRAGGLMVEEAVVEPVVGDVPAFQVSGVGAAPPPTLAAEAALPGMLTPSPAAANRRPGSRDTPGAPADQSQTRLWLVLSGIVAVLAAGIFAMWRSARQRGGVPPP